MRDLVQKDQWEHKEAEALAICRTKAKEHKLDIKVVRCNYSFNGGRLLVYFAAESRRLSRWYANSPGSSARASRCARSACAMRPNSLDGVGKVRTTALLHQLATRIHAGEYSHGEEPTVAAEPGRNFGRVWTSALLPLV
ncbi:MAG: PSP1 domain-containing protein [Caldilineaceae bacterium]